MVCCLALGSLVSPSLAAPPSTPVPAPAPWAGAEFPGGLPDFRLSPKTFFEVKPGPESSRKVFAWYMVCCSTFVAGEGTSVEILAQQYKAEIQMAQSMGIDGFGLDIMRTNTEYHNRVEAMFLAAKSLNSGFKLFFEVDDPACADAAEDLVLEMKKYAAHPNYMKVNGLPLLCAYAADEFVMEDKKPNQTKSIAWWTEKVIQPLRAQNIPVYFVPGTFQQMRGGKTCEEEIAAWGDTAQGFSLWQIQTSPIGGGLKVLERLGVALKESKKSWMSTIALHYWCGAGYSAPSWYWRPDKPTKPDSTNGTFYEHEGGRGLELQWQSIYKIQKPDWVMILTWNDYNESYILPIDDYRKYKNDTAEAPLGWYKSMVGLNELNRYYIQWYKTGEQPRITADSLFFSYRTSSQKLVAKRDPRPPVRIGNAPIGDNIYITTALTAPAQLRVVSGPTKTEHDIPAGITHTVVPFAAGKQSFSLWRGGKQITSAEGAPVVDAIDFYDYWPTTGHAIAFP